MGEVSDAHRILLRAEVVTGDPAAGAHERAVGHTIEVSVTGAFIESPCMAWTSSRSCAAI